MNKSIVRWLIVLAAVLAVYHVVIFAVPFPKNAIFFLSWVFALIAIGAQVYVVRSSYYRGESAKSKFYGFPIARIGAAYLTAQLVLSTAFMALGFAVTVPVWVPVVLYVVLLGLSVVGFVSADAMRDEIEQQDIRLKKDVQNMRMLQSKAASMVQLAQDDRVRGELEHFSEDLRFSDPVSSEALETIEADLMACTDEIQRAVMDDDREAVYALVQKARAALAERNRLCKLGKRSYM